MSSCRAFLLFSSAIGLQLCLLGCSTPSGSTAKTAATPPSSPEAALIFGIDGANNTIETYSLVVGSPSGGITPPSGFTISTVATDANGQLYVGGYTSSYDEILVYGPGSAAITTPSVSPTRTLQISGVSSPGATNAPTHMAVDAYGNMYALIAGSASVYELSASSSGLTVPRMITPPTLSTSTSIATDPVGNLYVLGSTGTSGAVDVFAASSTGAIQSAENISIPTVSASGIAVDASANLYLLVGNTDTAQIEKFAAGSSPSSPSTTLALPVPAGASLISLGSVQLDKGGNIYASVATSSTSSDELQLYGFAPGGTVPFLNTSQANYGNTTVAVY